MAGSTTCTSRYFAEQVQVYVPGALVVVLESPQAFFERTRDEIDAFVYSAEAGSAWSLAYPRFSVAVPQPDVVRIPIAFPLKPGDERLRGFLNTWIQLQRRDGTLDELHATWVLGQRPDASTPRWSVVRDVLHWVD
jgi:ABC-type amino acid transport substrate-binding protein